MYKFTPPEDFIYDERTGYYYTQRIEQDDEGNLIQHVVWFDPQTGDYTDQFYDIPDENDNADAGNILYEYETDDEYDDESEETYEEDCSHSHQSRRERQRASRGVIFGVIVFLVIVVLFIVGILVMNFMKNEEKVELDKDVKVEQEVIPQQERTEEPNVEPDAVGSEYSNVEVETHDFIKTSEKNPLDSSLADYMIFYAYPTETGYKGLTVVGTGDMTGEFLVNPGGYRTGDLIYSWDFFVNDKIGIRVYGLADCSKTSEPLYKPGQEYLKAAVVAREGDEVRILEEVPFYGSTDGFNLDKFDLLKYDASIDLYNMSTVEINISLGNYCQNGEMAPTIFYEEGLEIPSETVTDNSKKDSVMTDGVTEKIENEEERGVGVDLHSSGMPGFKHVGGFECTDSSLPAEFMPRINLEDDGYCELYANLGDGFYKMQGYYEYKSTGSEYDDQGGETYIYMHFPGNSDNLSYAELLYDGEIEGGYIYFLTDGFGLMGGDANYAGYFVRIY